MHDAAFKNPNFYKDRMDSLGQKSLQFKKLNSPFNITPKGLKSSPITYFHKLFDVAC